MVGSKPCTVCKRTLSLASFHRDSRAKDGRRSRCSACISKQSRVDSEKPPVLDRKVTHMVCGRCEKAGRDYLLPVGEFGVARRRRSGRNSWCRSCCSEATCAWQQTEVGRRKHIEAVKRYNEKRRRERSVAGP